MYNIQGGFAQGVFRNEMIVYIFRTCSFITLAGGLIIAVITKAMGMTAGWLHLVISCMVILFTLLHVAANALQIDRRMQFRECMLRDMYLCVGILVLFTVVQNYNEVSTRTILYFPVLVCFPCVWVAYSVWALLSPDIDKHTIPKASFSEGRDD